MSTNMLLMLPVILVAVMLMYLPGYLVLRAARLPREWAFVSAPPVTLAGLTIWGEVLSRIGVPASPVTLLMPITAIPAILAALLRNQREVKLPRLSLLAALLAVAVGLLVGDFVWAQIMPTSTAVYQIYDVVHHLSHVRTYLDTQRFTFFSDFYYPMPRDEVVNPWPSSGFYPSGWHMTCAALVQLTNAHTVTAYHALNLTFCGVVFPLASLALISFVFRGHTVAQFAGALAASAFAAFPWGLMGWGPIISQLAAFTMVPVAVWLFMAVIEPYATRPDRLRFCLLFVAALMGVALSQPNAAFAVALVLVPRVVVGIWRAVPRRKHAGPVLPSSYFDDEESEWDEEDAGPNPYARKHGPTLASSNPYQGGRRGVRLCHALALLFALTVAVLWCALPFSGPLSNISSFKWPAYGDPASAAGLVLSLDYVDGFVGLKYAAQPLLAAVLAAGIVRTFVERQNRWMALAYLIVALIMWVCVFDESALRSALAGYWYTDPYRVASMCAIAGVPLVAYGLAWPIEGVAKRFGASLADIEYVFEYDHTPYEEVDYAAPDEPDSRELAYGEYDNEGYNPYLSDTEVGNPYLAHTVPSRRTRPFAAFASGGLAPTLLAGALALGVFALVTYAGDLVAPGAIPSTAFSVVRKNAADYFDLNAPYSLEEDAFLQRVREEVGTDAVILNDPYDGSLFGWPLYNLRLTYRFNDGYIPGGERLESIDVRHRAHLYTHNEMIADDLRALGIEYVLQLDNEEHGVIFGPSDDYQMTFQGIRNVTNDTPGFELVLEEGNRKLYRLTQL